MLKWNTSKKIHYDWLVKEMGKIFECSGMQNGPYSDIPYKHSALPKLEMINHPLFMK